VSFLARYIADQPTLALIAAIVDIAIVYYLVYRLLLLIKGTRAVPMLIGLLLIILVFFASEFAGLTTLNWLLNNFFSVILLVVVVVFQQDIRRGLTRIGMTRFFQSAASTRTAFLIEELVKVCTALAAKKIGAIICIERQADMDEFVVEPGVKVDAAASKELLYSIFVPDRESPLHDGAVIIRSERVASAGNFLPLTQNPKHVGDRSLGTRHRAAIGVTEETDAVVLVVSEERGVVSLCFDGNISRDLGGGELRKALQRLLTDPSMKRRSEKAAKRRAKAIEEAKQERRRKDSTRPGTGAGASA